MLYSVIDRRTGQSVFSSRNFGEAHNVAAQDPENYQVVTVHEPGEVRL